MTPRDATAHAATSVAAPGAALLVNGEPLAPVPATVLDLVARRTGRRLRPDGRPVDGAPLGVAVAVNQEVVARSRWAEAALAPGDTVELLTAVQGG
ncbi:sulfur carrier protein ThiS [Zafaria sp. Z1313]|uniref:sulfur carrier protein ThiS n=1 Tax=unclassified Zafaria TaxID=2828765 RepID=UPI002E78AE1F|nr:sulfur carrier protein ThiS [Zafaria sp. J156]MEE1620377.1 sulfur carrier protein ThiS [Zafaria sp. J156]